MRSLTREALQKLNTEELLSLKADLKNGIVLDTDPSDVYVSNSEALEYIDECLVDTFQVEMFIRSNLESKNEVLQKTAALLDYYLHPAMYKSLNPKPKYTVLCEYAGEVYALTFASRLGDVGIKLKGSITHSVYDLRVSFRSLTNFAIVEDL